MATPAKNQQQLKAIAAPKIEPVWAELEDPWLLPSIGVEDPWLLPSVELNDPWFGEINENH